jgi:F-type H+-transporting ATPase subunit epsilon
MAAATELTVTFVTPEKQVSKGAVDMVIAPSALGEVGILPNHRPLLADLVPGVVELRHGGGTKVEKFAISGGFLEVDRNKVSLLVETAERPEEIDVERAQKALAAADAAVKKLSPADAEYDDQKSRLLRARVRLQVAGKG